MPTFLENLEKLNLPKGELPTLPAKVKLLADRLGVALTLTSPSAPEQYSITFGDQPFGYIRVRHGRMWVDFPDAGDETVYEGSVDGFSGFTNNEREAQLLFALGVVAARMQTR